MPPVIPVAPPPILLGGRGAACGERARCEDGLACLGFPGGYCGAATCDACDGGVCVETRAPAPVARRCLAACATDAECRVDEGYVCDPGFKACVLPNTTPIVPRSDCPKIGQSKSAWSAPIAGELPAITGPAVTTAERGVRVEGVLVGTGDYGVALRAGGRLHAVAFDATPHGAYGSAMHAITYASSIDGRTYSKPVRVSGDADSIPYYLANPVIAVDDRRKLIYVAYARGDRSAVWDLVIATSKDQGATWTRTVAVGDGCSLHALPALAVEPVSGTLHLGYYANGAYHHSTCGAGGVKCTRRGEIAPVAFTTSIASGFLGTRSSIVIRGKQLTATWLDPARGVLTSTAPLP